MSLDNEFTGLASLINNVHWYHYVGTYKQTALNTQETLDYILKELDRIGFQIMNRDITIIDQFGNEGFNENEICYVYLTCAVRYDSQLKNTLSVLPECIYRYNGNNTWSVDSEFAGQFLEKLKMVKVNNYVLS